MSDIMYPVSFDKLMNHILQEYALHQRIYNVTKIHHYEGTKVLFVSKSMVGISTHP